MEAYEALGCTGNAGAGLAAAAGTAVQVSHSEDLLEDACIIIEEAQRSAYRAVNIALVRRNWLLGKRIAEEELAGEERAEYGAQAIKMLAKELTARYGKGFGKTNLYQFKTFYEMFPQIFHTVCGKSASVLSWSHYRTLIQVNNSEARTWYAREAAEQTWSVRTLQRNIDSQYYQRMLASQHPDKVRRDGARVGDSGDQSDKKPSFATL